MIGGQEGPPLPYGALNESFEKARGASESGATFLEHGNFLKQRLQSFRVPPPSSEQTIFSAATKPEIGIQLSRIPRDIDRWPETGGFPPIMGRSGRENGDFEPEAEAEDHRYLTVEEAAKLLGVTPGRIHGMVAFGQLPAEKRKVRVEREMEKLFIPIEALEAYRNDPKRKHAPKHHRGNPKEGN